MDNSRREQMTHLPKSLVILRKQKLQANKTIKTPLKTVTLFSLMVLLSVLLRLATLLSAVFWCKYEAVRCKRSTKHFCVS